MEWTTFSMSMEGVLTEITDPNIVLETVSSRKSYLANKPAEKNIIVKEAKETKNLDDKSAKSAVYNTYKDNCQKDTCGHSKIAKFSPDRAT
ncbi:hypothetical protein INT48_002479 [Thamnidium elegans]|uniref:Uncharacterized protein n=1 Tax=Thamnidium elegans TaxID=101142 RepID=A0A8H7SJP3_9FUNG|nr:hypothetical protein INT48_002479 [Thamnidium elegans]